MTLHVPEMGNLAYFRELQEKPEPETVAKTQYLPAYLSGCRA